MHGMMNSVIRRLALFALLAATPAFASPAAGAVAGGPGWEVIVLFVAGLALLAVELFVLPGFGVAGVLGALAVVASIVLAVVGLPTGVGALQAGAVILTALVMAGVAVWQILERLPRDGRGQLRTSTRREDGYVASRARVELVGREGVAATNLHPSGTALIGEERVDVVSEGAFVPAGTPVRVVRADGYRHVVRVVE
jgi:membrane-bound serine protease (ClpP class)